MDNKTTLDLLALYESERKAINYPLEDIARVTDQVWRAYLGDNTIYACGNGGNAAYVANLITDLANHPFVSDDKSKPLSSMIPRLRAIDLCASSSSITGIMNDIGPESIFSQQMVNDKIRGGDILFGFTGSGNSPNVLKAFETAKSYGATTVALTRGNGGKSRELADYCIIIPGTSNFPGQVGKNDNNFHFEDATSCIAHMITGIMRERITKKHNGQN